jgi:hypothetical protein
MQSAFWHRFTATAHSPIGLDPKSHGLRILGPDFQGFARNDLIHQDRGGPLPDWIGEGLWRSMQNYLEGRGLKMDVRKWFEHPTPRPRVSPAWTKRVLDRRIVNDDLRRERRLVWLGQGPTVERHGRRATIRLGAKQVLRCLEPEAVWLHDMLVQASPHKRDPDVYPTVRAVTIRFPGTARDFSRFLQRPHWKKLRAAGLLLV